MQSAPGQEHWSSPAALPGPAGSVPVPARCRCRGRCWCRCQCWCWCHCSAWGHTRVNSSPVAFWQSRMGEEPRSAGSCLSCAREEHRWLVPPPSLYILSTPKKLPKFSLPPLTVTYLIIANWAPSLAQPPTFTPSPTAPRHLRKELKQPPAPPEHLLCSEVFDCTHSALVNDDGAAKGGEIDK